MLFDMNKFSLSMEMTRRVTGLPNPSQLTTSRVSNLTRLILTLAIALDYVITIHDQQLL